MKCVIPVQFLGEAANFLYKINNISIASGILLYIIYRMSILRYAKEKDRISTFLNFFWQIVYVDIKSEKVQKCIIFNFKLHVK